ncbi:DUF58 domain-containing protein [Amphibacillus xylanus]|uniref:DUF58 domain-containing protein n=1 Tax=Amphibacillus xylanus (strain ATCC 51415 / DSM 6626 / JCM 7361 / LMG 17667 / NBRC 15112 / Ep01) TaxID=698758 RepID=K0IZZ6_AMPXN|nr:DUF58 domain-containing protein [Amphibacillus xylanus]BAM46522.1 hypothetical protein AXY_03900 [Amphibacillus xylanus NBRC 15112]
MRRVVYLLMKLMILIILSLSFFSYAMFQGGFTSWFLFYISVPFLVYFLCFIFYPIRDWQVERILNDEKIEAGNSIRVTLNFKRRLRFPISYLIIEETVPKSLSHVFNPYHWSEILTQGQFNKRDMNERHLLYPNFRKHLSYQYQLTNLPRGIHTMQFVSITVSDIFGFIKKTVELPVQTTFYVTPKKINVQLDFSTYRQELGDKHVSTMHANRSNLISGARPYMPGDRLSSIHWKATAKTASLMTKDFDQEFNCDGTILLFGFNNHPAFEWNLSVCQMLLSIMKLKNLRVDCLFGGDKSVSLSNGSSHESLTDFFTQLKAGATESIVQSVFDRYQSTYDKGTFIVVFTDRLTDQIVRQLKLLSTQQRKLTIYVTRTRNGKMGDEARLELELRNARINVYSMSEAEIKQQRGVVTI